MNSEVYEAQFLICDLHGPWLRACIIRSRRYPAVSTSYTLAALVLQPVDIFASAPWCIIAYVMASAASQISTYGSISMGSDSRIITHLISRQTSSLQCVHLV